MFRYLILSLDPCSVVKRVLIDLFPKIRDVSSSVSFTTVSDKLEDIEGSTEKLVVAHGFLGKLTVLPRQFDEVLV